MLQIGANDEYISRYFTIWRIWKNREQLMQKIPQAKRGKGAGAFQSL